MSEPAVTEMKFVAAPERGPGEVSALLLRPADARFLYVFAHAASTSMRHPSMETLARALAEEGIATFRYQFPYMEKGGGGLDGKPVLLATVRSAVAAAATAAPDLPLLAGGRSMGGRMTSMAAAEAPLPGVRGLVFVAFPLHPSGKPGTERAEHLASVTVPMLFLSGTRDALAELDLLRPVCEGLGDRATLHLVEMADHSFHVPKKSGKTDAEVVRDLAQVTARWALEDAARKGFLVGRSLDEPGE